MPSLDLLNISGFNPRNALLLAYAAKIAYTPPTVMREEVKNRWGLTQFKWFDKSDTQAFVAANVDNIVIAFRGTQQDVLNDWLCDANFPFVKGPWGSVHRGFSQSLNYIWDDLLKTVKAFRSRNQSIWVTGHSLGAALAVLTSARLFNESLTPRAIYTFGQPRVGNGGFSNLFYKRFGDKYARFVNNTDIVANVPFYMPPFGYRHIGNTCFFFDEKCKLQRDYSFWEGMNKVFIKMFKSIRVSSDGKIVLMDITEHFPKAITDHSIDLYIKNLKSYIPALV